jgi:predicted hydrocarbon binding protein
MKMQPIPKSGYFFANRFALTMLEALEDVVGKNGLNAILHMANCSSFVDHYPPKNLAKEFDFADVSAINQAILEMYGERGGRGLALRAGRATFDEELRSFGALAGTSAREFQALPVQARLRVGLPALAKIFSSISDQLCSVEEREEAYIYTIQRCPACWGRNSQAHPVCYSVAGLLEESVKWISGGHEFQVLEAECMATGADACQFLIRKTPVG